MNFPSKTSKYRCFSYIFPNFARIFPYFPVISKLMMFFENDVPLFSCQKGAGHDRAWTAHGLGAYRLGTRMDRQMGPSSSREPLPKKSG
jgi:hypothetical protein